MASAVVLTTVSLTPGSASALAEDRPSREPRTQRVSLAQDALAEARRALRPASAGDADRHATMALRELAARVGDLATAGQRAEARALLARPTSDGALGPDEDADSPRYGDEPSGRHCDDDVCVHWVESGGDDAVDDDGDVSTVPDQVDATLTAAATSYAKYTGTTGGGLGYRAPVSDASAAENGGGDEIDIYLADLGSDDGNGSLYGYCTTDQPSPWLDTSVYGYCVVDEDFNSAEFPNGNTPTENLRVTVAHELFHLVQYSYDWLEDLWLMEGTAAWAEDEVFATIDDNLQYLADSQMKAAYYPLDYSSDSWFGQYGAWIWWRYLSEWAGAGAAKDPSIIRRIIYLGQSEDVFALQAVEKALGERRTTYRLRYAEFGTWLRNPARFFTDGEQYTSFVGPVDYSTTLTSAKKSTGLRSFTDAHHMTHTFVRAYPSSTLTGSWRARVQVNLPSSATRPEARVVVHRANGTQGTVVVPLNGSGDGSRVVNFTRSATKRIELQMTLAGASTRFSCWQGTALSCQGVPRDDNQRVTFNITAIR